MDCEYLKALTDLFAMAESEKEVTSATQNNGSCYHKQIDATVKTPEINSINQYTPSKSGDNSLAGRIPIDGKICPSIEFTYSQDLRVQDIFLPHSCRTPSSSSCEWLIATVKMPEEVGPVKEIKADIVDRRLVVSSPKYFLDVYLPQPPTSNQDSHAAKWDSDKKRLIVHVKLEREFDYVNF